MIGFQPIECLLNLFKRDCDCDRLMQPTFILTVIRINTYSYLRQCQMSTHDGGSMRII